MYLKSSKVSGSRWEYPTLDALKNIYELVAQNLAKTHCPIPQTNL